MATAHSHPTPPTRVGLGKVEEHRVDGMLLIHAQRLRLVLHHKAVGVCVTVEDGNDASKSVPLELGACFLGSQFIIFECEEMAQRSQNTRNVGRKRSRARS